MIVFRGIAKQFKGRPALLPFDLEVRRGEIFGLLGHNGAGKSTTLGILLGHVQPSAGEVWIDGLSVQRNRCRALRNTGAIFETPCFYEYLSGWHNLRYFVSLSGGAEAGRVAEVIELVGLGGRIHERVNTYSHGMRQRLALAQALLPRPDFLVLDEPNDGLDPEGIQEMRAILLRLRDESGMTLLFSSHILSEVEQLCERVAILNQGRQVFCGRWQEAAGSGQRVRLKFRNPAAAAPVLERAAVRSLGDGRYLLPEDADLAALIAALAAAGAEVEEAFPQRASLEDFYLGRIHA